MILHDDTIIAYLGFERNLFSQKTIFFNYKITRKEQSLPCTSHLEKRPEPAPRVLGPLEAPLLRDAPPKPPEDRPMPELLEEKPLPKDPP